MKTLLSIATILIAVHIVFAEYPVAWSCEYPYPVNSEYNSGLAVAESWDGGFLIAGSCVGCDTAGFARRLDNNGNIIWERHYPFYGLDYWEAEGIQSVALAQGHRFVLAGSLWQQHQGRYPHLVQIDSIGQICWERSFGPDEGAIYRVRALADGSFIGAGLSIEAGNPYIWKINSDGNIAWWQTVSTTGSDAAYDVQATSDGGYLVVGGGWLYQPPSNAITVFRLNAAHQIQWLRQYAFSAKQWARCCVVLPDGGYAVAGYIQTGSEFNGRVFFMRLNSTGDTLWTRIYGPESSWAYDLLPTADGGFLIGASSGPAENYLISDTAFVIRIDSIGNQLFSQKIFESRLQGMIATSDGGLAFTGSETYSWLAKLCPMNSPSAFPQTLIMTSDSIGLRLRHQFGDISELIFGPLPYGSHGRVTGTASVHWTTMRGGDGNDGDSVIFRTDLPLNEGVIDTFWVSRSPVECSMRWSSGCSSNLLPMFSGSADSIQFGGSWMLDGVHFTISVQRQRAILNYQIFRKSLYWGSYNLFATIAAIPDTLGHLYTYIQPGNPYQYYLLAVTDTFGCRFEYRDRILTYGENLTSKENVEFLPSNWRFSIYPNPFNPTTTLSFTLPKSGLITIDIFDVTGRKVETLQNGMMDAGEHQIRFDGSQLPSGIFFARFQCGEFSATQKLLLLK